MPVTNPNGANQYTLDPRQKLCWDLYVNPNSETFGNGLQSAIKAGYEEGTANQITTMAWFVEKLRRLNMLDKAERVLDKTLQLEAVDQEGKVQVDLLRVQTDVAKHLTKTLGKEHYSERTEVTGKDGEKLLPTPILSNVQSDESNEKGNEPQEATEVHSGGNISE